MVLFDLDGTLWDASREILDAWNICFEEHNLHPITLSQLCENLGKPLAEILLNLFPEESAETRSTLLPICSDFELEYLRKTPGKPFPGVQETLMELQRLYDLRFGIVSNCQSGYIEAFLDHYGFGKYFSDKLCYGDNGFSKGGNIRLLLERNHAEYGCYLGDTDGDRMACKEAGVPFYWAAYGFGKVTGEKTVNRLEDLPEMLIGS